MLRATDSFGELRAEADLFRLYLQGLSSGLAITASIVIDEGNFTDNQGKSDGLTWAEDRALLGALRRNSEIVLTSGLTARRESLRMPKTAKLAIMSRTGDLLGTELDTSNPNLLLLSGLAQARDYIGELRSQGFQRIQVELGLSTLKNILESSQLDLLMVSHKGSENSSFTNTRRFAFELQLGPGRLTAYAFGVAAS